MNLTREELLKVPKREWSEEIHNVRGVYVLPSRRKHESGFVCMDFVAETGDGNFVGFGGACDDIALIGRHFRMDCLHPTKIIHIWNPIEFYITHDISSIEFVEVGCL